MIHVGGASCTSCSRWRRSASDGRIHSCSWISLPSMVTSSPSARQAKKNVANRFGAMGGGHQWANQTRDPTSTACAASSCASRTEALRAAPSRFSVPS